MLSLSRRGFFKLLLLALVPLRTVAATVNKRKPFRLAFGSCAWQDDDQPIWDAIRQDRPDVFAFIGDNIYADSEDMTEIAGKYAKLGAIPAFQRFRREIPLIFTWDDHDFGVNDGGREYPFKRETKSLMLRFFGETDPTRIARDGVYTAYYFGQAPCRTQVILMDLRWWRSPLVTTDQGYIPNPDPTATMLGEEQWRWLEAELQKPADFRILASSTQLVSSDHPWEKWANFPFEKARLLALLDKYEVRNLAVISGDMHFGELSMEQTPGGFDLYDLTSSGLNYFEAGVQYPNTKRLAIFDTGCNYGNVTVDYDSEREIVVTLEVRDLERRTRISRELRYPRPSLMS